MKRAAASLGSSALSVSQVRASRTTVFFHFKAQVLNGTNHMFFHGADGNAKMICDIPIPLSFHPSQNEDSAGALWKAQEGGCRGVKFLLSAQNAFRVDLLLTMMIGIEFDIEAAVPRRAAAGPI